MPMDVRGAVIIALDAEITIGMQRRLFPFATVELGLRQRFEGDFLQCLEALTARDTKAGMAPIIDPLHALSERLIDLRKRRKGRAPIPEALIAHEYFHRAFDDRLVLWMIRARGHDGGRKMRTERGIARVQIGVVQMAFQDALLQAVRHRHVAHPAVEGEHAPVTAEPVAALHVLGRPREQQLAEAERGDEHPSLMDFAGLNLQPLDRIAGVIDLDALAGHEVPRRDARHPVLRELAVELLPKIRVRGQVLGLLVSRPQELPLWPLAEPCVKLALHTAPGVRSFAYQKRQCTNRCGSFRATWTSH